ncbi:hypothetical protein GCM10022252_61840 [Streptosporangium oxazolinicum]|uniref:Uncharacterized protein n=1 Tax=Streptosporangium oxazolinicum TaxID=909287 RepID=A0ABP8BDF2_9ACTN
MAADGQTPYDMKWCSAIQASSNPDSSATAIASTQSRSTRPCGLPGKPAATRKIPIRTLLMVSHVRAGGGEFTEPARAGRSRAPAGKHGPAVAIGTN